MRALREPPPAGTYTHVLRRYDVVGRFAIVFAFYTGQVQSRDIELNGKRAPTLFLNETHAASRARKLGWTDETEAWVAQRDGTGKPEESGPSQEPVPTTAPTQTQRTTAQATRPQVRPARQSA